MDELILQLSRTLKITFVIVTHELPSIFTVADRCIMLDRNVKTVVATGKPHELQANSDNPWVRQFFNRAELLQIGLVYPDCPVPVGNCHHSFWIGCV
jgi:ABC-type transporter Mla maintaining outer membrane lipid asymmetry ATPase subunit MlaF